MSMESGNFKKNIHPDQSTVLEKQVSSEDFIEENSIDFPYEDGRNSEEGALAVEWSINEMKQKFKSLENVPFHPAHIDILEKSAPAGRLAVKVLLPNKEEVILYRSSGVNKSTTGKDDGEWFAIPGFGKSHIERDDRWFIKTHESIQFKESNKYLKDMLNFFEYHFK